MSTQTESCLVHATSLALAAAAHPFGGPEDLAVLLLGKPGCGKSDVALRLIADGAQLIADDQTRLVVEGGSLFAECPDGLENLIEIRGIGIVKLERTRKGRVVLAAMLQEDTASARLPEPVTYQPPAPLSPDQPPPLVTLRPFEASVPAKIAAAACAAATGRFVAGVAPEKSP